MEGTALTYASPVFFSSLRKFFEQVNELENDKEHEQDDRFAATTFINLLLPKNARGEGRVTTNTKDGTLTVSNSGHSHKTSLATGVASPLFISVFGIWQSTQVMRGFEEDAMEAEAQFHDHELPEEIFEGRPRVRRIPDGENFEKKGD